MKRFINLSILIIAMVYLFYNFDFKKIDFSLLNVKWIVATIFLMILSKIILAFRWSKIGKVDLKISYETIVVSEFLNSIFPAKLGELSKLLYPKKFYGISLNNGASNLFIERFFDLLFLTFLMILFFYFYFENESVKNGIIALLIFIFMSVIFFRYRFFYEFLEKIPIKFFRIYAKKLYKNIYKTLKDPKKIFFYTLLLWGSYFLTNSLYFIYGVELEIDLLKSIEIFFFSTIALSLSVTPGGVATFEAIIVFVLGKYGIEKEIAFMVALIYHLIIFFVDFFLFEIFLFMKDIKFRELMSK